MDPMRRKRRDDALAKVGARRLAEDPAERLARAKAMSDVTRGALTTSDDRFIASDMNRDIYQIPRDFNDYERGYVQARTVVGSDATMNARILSPGQPMRIRTSEAYRQQELEKARAERQAAESENQSDRMFWLTRAAKATEYMIQMRAKIMSEQAIAAEKRIPMGFSQNFVAGPIDFDARWIPDRPKPKQRRPEVAPTRLRRAYSED